MPEPNMVGLCWKYPPRESNPHARRRLVLSQVCLPIPPGRHVKSGWVDSNHRPPASKAGTLAWLRYTQM